MANPQYFFTIRQDRDGFRARFWGNYGRELIWWTEGYVRRQSAENAVAYLRHYAASAPLL
ncbi:MAG: hypothetical protein QOG70_2761 [Solirubrobacteraceae bacterium]|nr:hypothetical protein [Solirubrobacteraceae bacterium]